MYFTKVIFY